ncbi:MAG: RsmG family class I SAM-dependent methyltransferase [Syntrophobacteraceae bacterium]
MRRIELNPSSGSDSYSQRDMAALLERSGISLSPGQLEQLWKYHYYLRQHNSELNLTRIHNFSNMVLKLYVDSLLPGKMIELPSPLLDMGTGPGMPGIPLKIAHPDVEVLLAESRSKRVGFLRDVTKYLSLKGVQIIGEAIGPAFEQPVAGVITRAVESIPRILDRIRGCLVLKGLAIFMKGPNCDLEIEEGLKSFGRSYRLIEDRHYLIPHTSHARRLVVFERTDEPIATRKVRAMKRHFIRQLDSEHNDLYKDLKKLLTSRGIKKQEKALVSGPKQTAEILKDFPEQCEAWISSGDSIPPPPDAPDHLSWCRLSPPLFKVLDLFGTNTPLLLIRIGSIPLWTPSEGLPQGCSVLVPFQDPENVGAVIRAAVAFGVSRVILLAESAHPYHPKAVRSSGGAVLRARIFQGPALGDLPDDLPIVPLSREGDDISHFRFSDTFALLPGIEGPGLPEHWRRNAVGIPISPQIESLNAATATAIALYLWSISDKARE